MRYKNMLLTFLLFCFGLAGANILDESALLAETIRHTLLQNDLKWEASSNEAFIRPYLDAFPKSISDLMKRLNGYLPLDRAAHDQWLSEIAERNSPRMTTTNDLVLSTYVLIHPDSQTANRFLRIEPVRNQQYYGSCWAFSTLGAFESARAVQVLGLPEGNEENVLNYSERWVGYHNTDTFLRNATNQWIIQDEDRLNGGNQYHAFYNSIRYGEMDERNAPYAQIFISDEERVPLPTSAYGAALFRSSKTILIPPVSFSRTMGLSYTEYLNAIKTAIRNFGSLAVTFAVPADFFNYWRGIYSPTLPLSDSYHAVTLVGWAKASELNTLCLNGKLLNPPVPVLDDPIVSYSYRDFTLPGAPRYTTDLFWILKNSYGYGWGDAGYFVVPAITAAQYSGESEIGLWMIETFDMFVPVFDGEGEHTDDSLDINRDGAVNEIDFLFLVSKVGATRHADIVACDIGYPKDGRITGDDASAWIFLYNVRYEK